MVFVMRHFEGYRLREIASVMNGRRNRKKYLLQPPGTNAEELEKCLLDRNDSLGREEQVFYGS
jgi:hypothetical protein